MCPVLSTEEEKGLEVELKSPGHVQVSLGWQM